MSSRLGEVREALSSGPGVVTEPHMVPERLVGKQSVSKCSAVSNTLGFESTSSTSMRSLRERQKHMLVRLYCLGSSDRETEIEAVLQSGTAAWQAGDAERMLQAVVQCVGLLSSPRNISTAEESSTSMTDVAKMQLRRANMTRLRALLIRLLGMHRLGGGLDLEDKGTCLLLRVAMERLRCLLHDRTLEQLASSRQWSA